MKRVAAALFAALALLGSHAPQAGRLMSRGTATGYNLAAAIAAVNTAMGVTVSLPTAPTLTSTCTASTAGELTTCLGTAGADITVTANVTGSFTANTTDQRLTINSGVTIAAPGGGSFENATALTVGASSRRLHIRGPGTINGSVYTNSASQDTRMDTRLVITTRTDATNSSDDTVHLYGTRILLESVTLTSRAYCDISDGAVDKVIANSDLLSNGGVQSCVRMVNTIRGVVMDSRIKDHSHHSLRAHSSSTTTTGTECDYIYWARNSIETDADDDAGGGIMSNGSSTNWNPQTLHLYLISNKIYGSGVAINDVGSGGAGHQYVDAIGNRIYTNTGADFTWGTFTGGTRSDNVKAAYQAPTWVMQ